MPCTHIHHARMRTICAKAMNFPMCFFFSHIVLSLFQTNLMEKSSVNGWWHGYIPTSVCAWYLNSIRKKRYGSQHSAMCLCMCVCVCNTFRFSSWVCYIVCVPAYYYRSSCNAYTIRKHRFNTHIRTHSHLTETGLKQ